MKKSLFTLLVISFCFLLTEAEEGFNYQNLYYISTSDSTAKLSGGYLIGDIVIPDTVYNNGNKYAVTEIAGGFNVTYNPRITSVVIPATVKLIRTQSFSGQTEITDIYFLGGGITFESAVFSLSSVIKRKVHILDFEEWCNNHYPQSNNMGVRGANPLYGAYMYINGEEVKDVHLSRKITSIPNNAFEGMLNQINLTCDTGLINIGDYAFMESKIQNIELPSSLKTIGQYAFRGCPIQNLTIPENITSIGSYAFDNNYQFHKIIWKAKSLHCQKNMPGYATFSLSSGKLDTLIIDTGVVSLPEYMFYSTIYAAKPVIITYNKKVPFVYQNTFYAVSKKSPLFVPYGKRTGYYGWGFTNVYEMEPDEADIHAMSRQALNDVITEAYAYYFEHQDSTLMEILNVLWESIISAQVILENEASSTEQLDEATNMLKDVLENTKKEVERQGTCVAEIPIRNILIKKSIIKDLFLIQCGDKTYTLTGQEVK